MEPKHIPVRYLDRLMALERRLRVLRFTVEDFDPEVASIIEGIETRLGGAVMMANRKGAARDEYRKEATGNEV